MQYHLRGVFYEKASIAIEIAAKIVSFLMFFHSTPTNLSNSFLKNKNILQILMI